MKVELGAVPSKGVSATTPPVPAFNANQVKEAAAHQQSNDIGYNYQPIFKMPQSYIK